MKFSIRDFFSKCDQIRSFLQIWSHLLQKSLMENFTFCAVYFKCLNISRTCDATSKAGQDPKNASVKWDIRQQSNRMTSKNYLRCIFWLWILIKVSLESFISLKFVAFFTIFAVFSSNMVSYIRNICRFCDYLFFLCFGSYTFKFDFACLYSNWWPDHSDVIELDLFKNIPNYRLSNTDNRFSLRFIWNFR